MTAAQRSPTPPQTLLVSQNQSVVPSHYSDFNPLDENVYVFLEKFHLKVWWTASKASLKWHCVILFLSLFQSALVSNELCFCATAYGTSWILRWAVSATCWPTNIHTSCPQHDMCFFHPYTPPPPLLSFQQRWVSQQPLSPRRCQHLWQVTWCTPAPTQWCTPPRRPWTGG